MTVAQERRALRVAAALAAFAACLNDSYPFPPDRRHIQLEDLAKELQNELTPKRLVRPKRR